MKKINVTKEWCEKSAEIEGTSEVGAGCPPRSCSMFSEDWWEGVFDGRGSFAGDFNRSTLVFSEMEVRAIITEQIGRINLSENA